MSDKNTSSGKKSFGSFSGWLENFWYHYKLRTIIAVVAIVTLTICTVQFFGREVSDYYLIYAGPQPLMLQDLTYMEDAVCSVGRDVDNNGKISVAFDDIVMLSPEEQAEATASGGVLNGDFMLTSMKEYEQQIFGGDAIVCFLSPYMYEIVHSAGGFMPVSEIFDEIPEAAYDECAITLSKTDFGTYFNGMNDLPEDTLVCVRKLSSMAVFKGVKKSEKLHSESVELFRAIVNFEAPEE